MCAAETGTEPKITGSGTETFKILRTGTETFVTYYAIVKTL